MKAKNLALSFAFLVLAVASKNFAQDDDDKGLKFGFYTDRVMLATQTIVLNESLNKRIAEIGNRIAKQSDQPEMNYTFRVINDPTINAFAASGGFVYVTTGLLDVVQSEDELAAVLGHEIVHTSKNHPINFIYEAHSRAQKGKIAGLVVGSVLGVALGAAVASDAYSSQQMVKEAVDLGFDLGEMVGNSISITMIQGYGKKQELEADAGAVHCTTQCGYDPYALISVFKRLASIRDELGLSRKNYMSSLINAKPGLEERISNLEHAIMNTDKN